MNFQRIIHPFEVPWVPKQKMGFYKMDCVWMLLHIGGLDLTITKKTIAKNLKIEYFAWVLAEMISLKIFVAKLITPLFE